MEYGGLWYLDAEHFFETERLSAEFNVVVLIFFGSTVFVLDWVWSPFCTV
jgi:hypothetical protein